MFWQKGRQSKADEPKPYKVKHLMPTWLCSLLKFDLSLIKYEEGSSLPYHVDNDLWWNGYDTVRTNFELRTAQEGGCFQISGVAHNPDKIWKTRKFLGMRVVTFRPDIMPHRVTKVKKGSRLVLSLGRFKKTDRTQIGKGSEVGKFLSGGDILSVNTLLRYYKDSYMNHKLKVSGLTHPCTDKWGQYSQESDTYEILVEMRKELHGKRDKSSRHVIDSVMWGIY